MQRRHLLEIHEQPWCPTAIRSGATDCLRFIATVGRQYKHVLPKLEAALVATGSTHIVDLCSGSGGPWPTLHQQLSAIDGERVQILLTDLYPQVAEARAQRAQSPLTYVPTAIDATAVPPDLRGLRTLFTAFHHFEPATAQAILQDAVDQRQGIAIFEQTRRHPLALLLMVLLAPLAFLAVPFIWPWRPSRFFWTYLLPAIPLVLCVDGIVSCLRTYTPDELRGMTTQLTGAPYQWAIGHAAAPLSPIGVLYAIGYPIAARPGTRPGAEWGNPEMAS
jgi:hypothetical protein